MASSSSSHGHGHGHISSSDVSATAAADTGRGRGKKKSPGEKLESFMKKKVMASLFDGGGQGNESAVAAVAAAFNTDDDDEAERADACRIVEVFTKLREALAAQRLTYSREENAVSSVEKAKPTSSLPEPAACVEALEQYQRELQSIQFSHHSMSGLNHYFSKELTKKGALGPSKSMMKAIFKEWTALKTSLPLNLCSSIFVRMDEDAAPLLQALITGPEGTPYSNGCFLFDVYFPPNYPQQPPQVNSRTNGGGAVRFNPNLYNNGKVCLSLLGTWGGEKGESWNAATSTLLQVLVSVQSLILIDDPYFNEPGYEASRGSSDGNKQSEAYNKEVRKNCVKWAMLEQLRSPAVAFANVVTAHFKLKKARILELSDIRCSLQQLAEWKKLDSGLSKDVENMKNELEKL